MRLIAAGMIVFSCAALGIMKAHGLTELDRMYSSLISALELIKSEICTSHAPLDSALSLVMQSSDKSVEPFFGAVISGLSELGDSSFCDIWTASVQSELTALPKSCVQSLVSLGNSLGRYDADMQKCAIERCSVQLEVARSELRAAAVASKRMYVGTGASAGLIIAIIML